MAETRLEDVVIPADFRDYVIEQSFADNALIDSGAFTRLTDNTMKGGYGFSVASWGKIPGRSHVIVQGTNLPVESLDTNVMTAIALARGKAVGFHDLVQIFSGQNPWPVLAQRFVEFWKEDTNYIVKSVLDGVFAAANMSGSIYDITDADTTTDANAQYFGRTPFIRAGQIFRSRRSTMALVIMDSYTEAYMSINNAVQNVPLTDQNTTVTRLGNARVLVDDILAPPSGDEHELYVLGTGLGAFIEKTGVPDDFNQEAFRNALASYSAVVQRRVYTPHITGTSWVGTVGPVSPTNAELATGTNWTRIWDNQAVPIVKVRYRLPTD